MLGLREEARRALGSLVGVAPEQVAITGSTTDGCNIVVAGLDLQPRGRNRHDARGALRAHRPALRERRARRRRGADPDAIRAAVTPRTRLLALSQVLWTTGRLLPVKELREQTGVPVLVDGAQSVGAIPVDCARDGLPDDLRAEMALRARFDGRARRRRSGGPSRCPAELLLAEGVRADRLSSSPQPERRASTRGGSRPQASRVSSPRSSCRRTGASSGRPSRPRGAGSYSRRTWTSSRAVRRWSRSAPRIRPPSSRGSPRRVSSSASCPARGSSALRAAGGRATRIWTGSSPA